MVLNAAPAAAAERAPRARVGRCRESRAADFAGMNILYLLIPLGSGLGGRSWWRRFSGRRRAASSTIYKRRRCRSCSTTTLEAHAARSQCTMHELTLGTRFRRGSARQHALPGDVRRSCDRTGNGARAALRAPAAALSTGAHPSYGIGRRRCRLARRRGRLGVRTSRWSAVLRLGTALIVVLIGLNIALGPARRPWLRAPERWGAPGVAAACAACTRMLPTQPALRALTLGIAVGLAALRPGLFSAAGRGVRRQRARRRRHHDRVRTRHVAGHAGLELRGRADS